VGHSVQHEQSHQLIAARYSALPEYTQTHANTNALSVSHSIAESKVEGSQLDRVTVPVLGEYGQAREAHGQRQERGYWPTEPQGPDRGTVVLHGQVTLHLHLVDTVHRDVREHSTQHQ